MGTLMSVISYRFTSTAGKHCNHGLCEQMLLCQLKYQLFLCPAGFGLISIIIRVDYVCVVSYSTTCFTKGITWFRVCLHIFYIRWCGGVGQKSNVYTPL